MVDLVQFRVHLSFLVCTRGKREGALLVHALGHVVRGLGGLAKVPRRKDAEVALEVFDGYTADAVRQRREEDDHVAGGDFNACLVGSARSGISNRGKAVASCILLSVRAGRADEEVRALAKIDPTSKVGVGGQRASSEVFVPRLFWLFCAFFAKARAVFALSKVVAGIGKGFYIVPHKGVQRAADVPKNGSIEHGGKARGTKGAEDGGGGGRRFKFGRIAPGVQHRIANKGQTANEKENGTNVKDSVALGAEVLDGVGHVRPIGRCEVVSRKVRRIPVAEEKKLTVQTLPQIR